MHRPHVKSGGRYPVLRAVAILQIIAAVLVAIGGVVTSINVSRWVGPTGFNDITSMVLGFVATFFMVVLTLGSAELIKLLIDIEHNTRMVANGHATNGQASAAAMGTGDGTRPNRLNALEEEESAEAALIRGH